MKPAKSVSASPRGVGGGRQLAPPAGATAPPPAARSAPWRRSAWAGSRLAPPFIAATAVVSEPLALVAISDRSAPATSARRAGPPIVSRSAMTMASGVRARRAARLVADWRTRAATKRPLRALGDHPGERAALAGIGIDDERRRPARLDGRVDCRTSAMTRATPLFRQADDWNDYRPDRVNKRCCGSPPLVPKWRGGCRRLTAGPRSPYAGRDDQHRESRRSSPALPTSRRSIARCSATSGASSTTAPAPIGRRPTR